jgi:hypothetical protein
LLLPLFGFKSINFKLPDVQLLSGNCTNLSFTIAWRNLISNKVSALINIDGLAVGMAVSFMLLLYVYNEFSFDKFHNNNGRLYQIVIRAITYNNPVATCY